MNVSSKVFVLSALLLGIYFTTTWGGDPWTPEPRKDDPEWMDMHEAFVRNTRENASNIHCVFIGSSSIEYWASTGKDIWEAKYLPLGCVNYGIGGDKTENMLWRVQNGELDGLNPKLIAIYIGTNNINTEASVDDIIRGVSTVLSEVRVKLPTTPILHMEIFPRGGDDIENAWNEIIDVNTEIHKLNDGTKLVSFSMFWDLADGWYDIKEELFASDNFHLSEAGYAQWDLSWNSTFWDLWNNNLNNSCKFDL